MLRRLINLVTALSLLVCLAAAALWIRNLWAADKLLHRSFDAAGRRTGDVSLPVVRLRRAMRRRRRLHVGACPSCGYDLRATPGRCPECGTTPSAEAAKA